METDFILSLGNEEPQLFFSLREAGMDVEYLYEC